MLTTRAALAKDHRNANAPVLQHRHYAFIAGVIADMPDHAATLRAQKRSVALSFTDALARTNPRFDRDRFLRACNITATLEDLEPYLTAGG